MFNSHYSSAAECRVHCGSLAAVLGVQFPQTVGAATIVPRKGRDIAPEQSNQAVWVQQGLKTHTCLSWLCQSAGRRQYSGNHGTGSVLYACVEGFRPGRLAGVVIHPSHVCYPVHFGFNPRCWLSHHSSR